MDVLSSRQFNPCLKMVYKTSFPVFDRLLELKSFAQGFLDMPCANEVK